MPSTLSTPMFAWPVRIISIDDLDRIAEAVARVL